MKIRKYCRICKGRIQVIIKFEKICLVGKFLKIKKQQKKYPLSLNFCRKCMHLQIAEVINPKKLFSNYFWETKVSKTNLKIFQEISQTYKRELSNQTKIFEIASNDGSFLEYLQKKFKTFNVGIDPASNLNKKIKNIFQIKGFFSFEKSKEIFKKFGKFDLIFARNVLAHVSNPNDIFLGIKKLLNQNGKAIIEVPHLLPIIKKLQYDNIFHEHQGFHSLKSIKDLCNKNNLFLTNVTKIKSQGGSIRCEVRKNNVNNKELTRIRNFIKFEKKKNLFNLKYLKSYKHRVLNHKKEIKKMLKNLSSKNKKISIYGASGKGQALLQFCGIDYKIIDRVYDKSKLKNNRFTPGTNILINHPKKMKKEIIDYLFLSSWNLKEEIMKQEKKFIKSGGQFIIPFPKPRIIKK